jgi:hypothetical protein
MRNIKRNMEKTERRREHEESKKDKGNSEMTGRKEQDKRNRSRTKKGQGKKRSNRIRKQ